MAATDSFESTVTETLTSEVDTMSTGQRWLVKNFKDAFEKSMRHQHARGHDVHDGDALLGRNRLERIFAFGRVAVMRVPSFFGLREFRI